MQQLKTAVSEDKTAEINEFTDDLVKLTEGIDLKLQKVKQATALLSSVERRWGEKLSIKNKRRLKEAVKKLQDAQYERVKEEIVNLREMITLLEADYGDE